jgi:hypothetical protein
MSLPTCALVARVDDGGGGLPGRVRTRPRLAQRVVVGDPPGRPLDRRHRRPRHRRRRRVRVHAARGCDRAIRVLHVLWTVRGGMEGNTVLV